MASFKRHQQNKDVPYSEGCGGLMWDAWGGSSGINWAISKLKQIDKEKNKLWQDLTTTLTENVTLNGAVRGTTNTITTTGMSRCI